MKIEYQLTETQLLKSMDFVSRKLSKRGRRFILLNNIVATIFILLIIFMFIEAKPSNVTLFSSIYWHYFFQDLLIPLSILIFAVISAALFRNAYRYPGDFLKKWIKTPINQIILLKKTMTLDDNGIHTIDTLGNESTLSWLTFGRVLQTDDFFLLETQEDRFVTIPKEQLSTKEIDYIDNILLKHLPTSYIADSV